MEHEVLPPSQMISLWGYSAFMLYVKFINEKLWIWKRMAKDQYSISIANLKTEQWTNLGGSLQLSEEAQFKSVIQKLLDVIGHFLDTSDL